MNRTAFNIRHTTSEKHDFYATDPKTVYELLERESFSNEILEPCAGMGHIANVLKEKGYNVTCSDLIDRSYPNTTIKNFFDYDKNNLDIITNPPYKLADESDYRIFISFIENQDYPKEWVASKFLELLEELREYIRLVRRVDDEYKVHLIAQVGNELYDLDEDMIDDYIVLDSDSKLLDFIVKYYDKGLAFFMSHIEHELRIYAGVRFNAENYIEDLIENTDFIEMVEFSYLINKANITNTIEYHEPREFYTERERYDFRKDLPIKVEKALVEVCGASWRTTQRQRILDSDLVLFPNIKDGEDFKKAILEEFKVPERLWSYITGWRSYDSKRYTSYGVIDIVTRF